MPTFTVHALSDAAAEEARRSPGAVPAVAGDGPYPVRCCLSDAHDADGVVLASVMPFRGDSPYAARSPVYVHAERCAGYSENAGVVPDMLRGRLLSVRAYDGMHMLSGTEVLPGEGLEGAIERLLGDAPGAYLHVHFAGPGCYACRIDRVAA
ncbi:MAG TPA: DUF1203 domain-containing protein [Gaiellales bacterium]